VTLGVTIVVVIAHPRMKSGWIACAGRLGGRRDLDR
jgi:hypothetical protein